MNLKCLRLLALCAGLVGIVNSTLAQTWVPATNAPNIGIWSSIASSADGVVLLAAANAPYAYPVGGGGKPLLPIYLSTNAGAVWTTASVPRLFWQSVACSADGSRMIAVSLEGLVCTSTNWGGTWASNSPAAGVQWLAAASSADGARLAIAGQTAGITAGPAGGIYVSADGGANWSLSDAPATNWTSLAASADGSRLVATQLGDYLHYSGAIYTSTNSGKNWVLAIAPAAEWLSAASSADGTRLVAASDSPVNSLGPGLLCLSTNAGLTWAPSGAPPEYWNTVACSADGTKLVAAGSGALYTSADSGATWTSNNIDYEYWLSAASSADGGRLAVVGWQIYTSASSPTPWLKPALSGGNLVLSWTVPSTSLVLQQNPDLATGNWTDVPGVAALNLTTLQYQVAVALTNARNFYRLESR